MDAAFLANSGGGRGDKRRGIRPRMHFAEDDISDRTYIHNGWKDGNVDARANTAYDPATSDKNLVNFGRVTPAFCGLNAGLSLLTLQFFFSFPLFFHFFAFLPYSSRVSPFPFPFFPSFFFPTGGEETQNSWPQSATHKPS